MMQSRGEQQLAMNRCDSHTTVGAPPSTLSAQRIEVHAKSTRPAMRGSLDCWGNKAGFAVDTVAVHEYFMLVRLIST